MKLQMNRGTDSIGHDGVNYVVSNQDWTVTVPDHVGHVLLATAAGAVRIPDDPEPEPVQCPKCGHTFKGSET